MSNAPVPPDGPIGAQPDIPVCARHSDRPTRLRCSRCDRPACPDCLRDASVGMQCVDCVNEGARTVRQARTSAGAVVSTGRPIITQVMIALNVLAYVATVVQSGSPMNNSRAGLFTTTSMIPELTANGEWWRILTSGFMHFGLIHLALNMAALFVVGPVVEQELGKLRYSAVYFLSLLGGSAAAFFFGTVCQQLAGASGAVFGLMGALLIVFKRQKRDISTILVVVGINLVSNLFTNASLLGHLGGFVIGGLLTLALVKAPAKNRNAYQIGAVAAAALLLGVMFVLRASQLDTAAEVILEYARTCR
ncbi:rhomboid family intramembrane serine protease [Lentzea flaviverrucosa]|uniref:Membrane associated serine protease, rhomboid family n=1 Tax=Lentzea flaviverrucosa TaxID=200379 RepID=A0A1H9XUE8_9PSEU|nr:rhomboid family intramembrane serine protease [Lentzea flaviverrucosa]RDI18826.1 membrane associated rhomboid family serine protease [Lentzea flaviverrucosa]SES49798.1 Membrane associated serine protease, rhomboid family [Lentzea flaviverrucosa]